MTVVMVTGAAGFVGLNVVRSLATRGRRVLAISRQAQDTTIQTYLAGVNGEVIWTRGDIRDAQSLASMARKHRVDVIVHAAGLTPTPVMEISRGADIIQTNLMGTVSAMEALVAAGGSRFVFLSSTGVYGSPAAATQQLHEDQPLVAGTLYAICKIADEGLCRRYAELHGFSGVTARLGTVFGPMERVTGSREKMSLIFEIATYARVGMMLRVSGGSRLRDFCYVDDVADAVAGLSLAQQLTWDTYNVATDVPLTVTHALDAFAQACPGFTWKEAKGPEEADLVVRPDQARGPTDLSRLRKDLNYAPRYSLERGIEAYVARLQSGEGA